MQPWSRGKLVFSISVAFLAIGSILTVWAKDFWDDKPFTQWSEQEAMRILA
jgi:hypothetical protein